ncbi:hypothetical protein QA600_15890 [Natronococcus sp. A-GB1]|uniref:hypothetical protein n=1 Tax=Natronococcus sp. A-GB1 TaxID=3037648 RepID=UPI00241DBAA0|nr:hypothetical protein [Natronococcus sp. A-GB1]MDG5760818.1 hypothetical protein [Natronococcus sp. A-GB1]
MTSIRDLLGDSLAVGKRFRLELEQRDEILVAAHPHDASPMDVAVVEGLEKLEEQPPREPVEVEIVGRVVDGMIAGRVVSTACGGADTDARTE